MLELNPSYSETYYNIGCVYKDMGQRDLEIVEYQKCLQMNPQHAKCYNNTGVVMNEIKQNFPEALKNFELAVQYDPENPLYLCNKGGVLLKLGRD